MMNLLKDINLIWRVTKNSKSFAGLPKKNALCSRMVYAPLNITVLIMTYLNKIKIRDQGENSNPKIL
jgi:hypothetical protein